MEVLLLTLSIMCSLISSDDLAELGQQEDRFWGDAKGGWLDGDLVREARGKELQYVRKLNVLSSVQSV